MRHCQIFRQNTTHISVFGQRLERVFAIWPDKKTQITTTHSEAIYGQFLPRRLLCPCKCDQLIGVLLLLVFMKTYFTWLSRPLQTIAIYWIQLSFTAATNWPNNIFVPDGMAIFVCVWAGTLVMAHEARNNALYWSPSIICEIWPFVWSVRNAHRYYAYIKHWWSINWTRCGYIALLCRQIHI